MPQVVSVKENLPVPSLCFAPLPNDGVVSDGVRAYSQGDFGGLPMRKVSKRLVKLVFLNLACIILQMGARAADEPALSREEIKQFLQTADIIKSKPSSKGVTHPWKLTLSNGTITHDASFQSVDEHSPRKELSSGKVEVHFVDSYKYNIAAYRIAELIGLEAMLPVYVERKWEGKNGSLSWWLPAKMDEADRYQKKIEPPDGDKWNRQMFRMRVFDELVYDSDPNLTNVLIGEDWTLWRVDFSRAFRTSKDLRIATNLVKCDRQLLEKLKTLQANEVTEKTKGYLTKEEVSGLMARRDKIVARFQTLIAEKGEKEILY
jgi:hypothetical protein